MPRYSVPLKAGVLSRLPYPGRALQVVNSGVAQAVQLQVEWGGNQQAVEDFGAFHAGDAIKAGTSQFSALSLTSAVDTTVDLMVSLQDVALMNGQNVNATVVNPLPLPVSNDRGAAPGAPVFVSGLTYNDTPAGTVIDNASVAAGPAAAALVAADATRLEAVIYNQGPDPVAIGQAGITWAKRAIVLNAGDVWIETRAAAKAWQVITGPGGASAVTVQERKA